VTDLLGAPSRDLARCGVVGGDHDARACGDGVSQLELGDRAVVGDGGRIPAPAGGSARCTR
jgi:hypothetical protein